MALRYSNKKMQMLKEKQIMKDLFEKQILQSKLEMQEQTFNFISQEIHDNVGQVLSLAKVQLNIIDQQQEIDRSILKDVKENISKAMTELRDMAKSLSSERIQSFDLSQGIKDEVNRINKSGLIKASINIEGSCHFIKNQHKIIVFRLIQESLQNILKHAQASEISIFIKDNNKKSDIVISDNGIGFDVEAELKKDNGLGLKNIINRATLIGGNATINSNGEGTSISIIIPHE
ncbi:MAG: ATP-binding protein [Segetibacter sp.]